MFKQVLVCTAFIMMAMLNRRTSQKVDSSKCRESKCSSD
jgi:hypothetical protein